MAQRRLKKDFDKEQMYSKIMPSYGRRTVDEEPGRDLPRSLRESPDDEYVLRNFIEEIVFEKVERTIEMLRGCGCELCRKKVMAMALNELPSAYEVVARGEVELAVAATRMDYEVKASAALIKAVQAVKNSPCHGGEEERHGG